MSRLRLAVLLVLVLVAGGVIAVVIVNAEALAPARSLLRYPWDLLAEEAQVMNDCVECHEPEDYHTCASCHDDHGSAEMASVPFDDLLLLTGDVPEPGYIPINEILPNRDQLSTHVTLLDFLGEHGVTAFESVTLAATDGGFVTFERPYLTDEAMLMPHVDGLRFAAENLHVSTWLKGICRVIVVGTDRPLTVNGQRTSMGRLLLGPTRSVTIEQTDVMLKSKSDGEVRKGKTASRIEGAAISDVVSSQELQELWVLDADGDEHTLTAEEADGALLAMLETGPEVVLVLPDRGRAHWVSGVVEIRSQR
jgi:hypothetical protein